MIDVMAKLKEIAESGYDNEDIQRGIAAAEGQYGKKKKKYEDEEVNEAKADPAIVARFAKIKPSQRSYYIMKWAEENGIDGDDAMEMAGYERGGYMGAGAYKWNYVGESEELSESKMICKHCGDEIYKPKSDCHCDCSDPNGSNWLVMESTEVPAFRQALAEAAEADVEEVHEEVEEDYDDLSDILKLAGQSGVLGMKTPQTLVVEDIEVQEEEIEEEAMADDDIAEEIVDEEAVEETVEIPVSALADLMKLAGYENYETKVEEYANEPEPEYMDTEDQMIGLSGGMNGPKKMYPAAAGADNPMDQEPREVEESEDTGFDNFYEKYDAFVESLRD